MPDTFIHYADPQNRNRTGRLLHRLPNCTILHQHLSRVLGKDIFTQSGYRIAGRAMLEVYSRAIISPELAAKAAAGYESY